MSETRPAGGGLMVQDLDVWYGHVHAVRGISLKVDEGEIVALLGPNGAGKTTTLKAVTGLVRPRSGQIRFAGTRIDRMPTERIVRRGIAVVPEGRRIFPGLSVYENLEVAAVAGGAQLHRDLDRIFGLFPRLKERLRQPGWSLSGGEQQMLAIGRALVAKPSLLLLDEPSLGLAPSLVAQMFQAIREINQQGCTILVIEQNAFMALRVARRGYVMENGAVVLDGPAEMLVDDPRVKAAYVGG